MPDIFVQSFTHLTDRHNADKALDILKRVASLVKPIMRKHSWVLPVLSEFFPDNTNLLGLNVNMGQQILVRLRPAHSPNSFLPEEDIIGTMLHELTHNVHGPHDDKFYKYLSGLQDEFDALQRSGYAGEGFFSAGKRLGVNVSHDVPPHIARVKALEAAEKRKQLSRVLGGGRRLGGLGQRVNSRLSPREMAARNEGPVTRSLVPQVIDLTLDDNEDTQYHGSDSDVIIVEDVHRKPNAVASSSKLPSSKSSTTPTVPKSSGKGISVTKIASSSSSKGSHGPGSTRDPPTKVVETSITTNHAHSSSQADWPCPTCTLLNPATATQCGACQMRKPIEEREGWTCHTCWESGLPDDFWTCRWCGTVKLSS
ncbi:WLM domain-containing protein [Crassisporium funariophilum]|nr:WLM domain-containing protein [Crassisporium funariophilum]